MLAAVVDKGLAGRTLLMNYFRLYKDPVGVRADRIEKENDSRIRKMVNNLRKALAPVNREPKPPRSKDVIPDEAEVVDVTSTLGKRKRPEPGSMFEPGVGSLQKRTRRSRIIEDDSDDEDEIRKVVSTPVKKSYSPSKRSSVSMRGPKSKVGKKRSVRTVASRRNTETTVSAYGTFKDNAATVVPIGYEGNAAEARTRPIAVLSDDDVRDVRVHHTLRRAVPNKQYKGVPRNQATSSTGHSAAATVLFDKMDPTPFLTMAHIPNEHTANIMLSKADVEYMRDMAWFWGTYGALRDIDAIDPFRIDNTVFKTDVENQGGTIAMSYFQKKAVEVRERGYTILEDFGDPTSTAVLRNVTLHTTMPASIPTQSNRDLFEAVENTFDAKEALKGLPNAIWYGIFNHADGALDEADKRKGIARYSTSWEFNMSYLLKPGPPAWMAKARVLLDVYVGQLCAIVELRSMNDRDLYLPVSGGQFLLTGKDYPAQVGHNDFDHRQGTGPGFFVIVTGAEPANLWVCDGSHKHVGLSAKKRNELAQILRLKRITIPRNSVFIGHGFLQHAGAEWSGNGALRYHAYLIPDGHVLHDAVAFAYEMSFRKQGEDSSSEEEENGDRDSLKSDEDDDGDDDGDFNDPPITRKKAGTILFFPNDVQDGSCFFLCLLLFMSCFRSSSTL